MLARRGCRSLGAPRRALAWRRYRCSRSLSRGEPVPSPGGTLPAPLQRFVPPRVHAIAPIPPDGGARPVCAALSVAVTARVRSWTPAQTSRTFPCAGNLTRVTLGAYRWTSGGATCRSPCRKTVCPRSRIAPTLGGSPLARDRHGGPRAQARPRPELAVRVGAPAVRHPRGRPPAGVGAAGGDPREPQVAVDGGGRQARRAAAAAELPGEVRPQQKAAPSWASAHVHAGVLVSPPPAVSSEKA